MYHSRAHNFYPASSLAKRASCPFALETFHIHLNTRLYKRKKTRAEANFRLIAEKFSEKCFERPLQMSECYVLVYCKPFQLKKLRLVRRIGRLVAIHFSGHDNAERRLVRFHIPELHGARMRPQ